MSNGFPASNNGVPGNGAPNNEVPNNGAPSNGVPNNRVPIRNSMGDHYGPGAKAVEEQARRVKRKDARWGVIHTPAGFHKSFPEEARPRLKLFKDYWFWIYLVLAIPSVTIGVTNLVLSGVGANPADNGLAVAAGLGMIQVLVGVIVVLLLKISRGTPKRLILMALIWGAFVAPMIAGGLLSLPWLNISEKMGWYSSSFSLAAAVPEEMIKALGVFVLLWIGRAWWNRPWHGLVAGLLVGLGFEAFENTLYAVSLAVIHPVSDIDGALQIFFMRVLLGAFLHMLLTGLAGYGIGRAMYEGEHWGRGKRWLSIVVWVGLAVALHYGWNFMAPGETTLAWELGVKIVLWLIMAGALVFAVIRETRRMAPLMRAGLEPAVTVYHRY